MGSFDLVLVTLFLFSTFSFELFPVAKSDEKLINMLCSKTEEAVLCEECLQSDPKSKSASGQGLALIALSCAERDTTQLYEETDRLLQNATGKLKEILDYCDGRVYVAQQDFPPIAGYVQKGSYSSAKGVIQEEIIPFVISCLRAFDKEPQLPVPQMVLAGIVASNQTCNIAVGILSNI